MTQLTQPSALSPEQLLKRSRELDARETYLATREQLAEDVELAITKGQHNLSLLDATILARETILDDQNVRLGNLEAEYTSKEKSLANSLAKEQERYESCQTKVETARQELKTVKDAVTERTNYLKQQEILVQEQVMEGNSRLRGLDYEITELKQVIRDLEVKKKSLKATIIDLDIDLTDARDNFLPELAEHEQAIKDIDARKDVLDGELVLLETRYTVREKEVNELGIRYKRIEVEIDEKLKVLDVKERGIMAKRSALAEETATMEEARHYHHSTKSLYDSD